MVILVALDPDQRDSILSYSRRAVPPTLVKKLHTVVHNGHSTRQCITDTIGIDIVVDVIHPCVQSSMIVEECGHVRVFLFECNDPVQSVRYYNPKELSS